MQSGFDAIDDQGVTSVVAALKTHHALCAFSQPVDKLALAFVTPLGADHHHVSCLLGTHSFIVFVSVGFQRADCPNALMVNQFTVAMKFVNFAFVTRQHTDHGMAL